MGDKDLLNLTSDQVEKQFGFVHELIGEYGLSVRAASHPKKSEDYLLIFGVEKLAKPANLAIVTDRYTLLGLARYILRELDPTPEQEILDNLKEIQAENLERSKIEIECLERIEKLLEQPLQSQSQ